MHRINYTNRSSIDRVVRCVSRHIFARCLRFQISLLLWSPFYYYYNGYTVVMRFPLSFSILFLNAVGMITMAESETSDPK